MKSIMDPSFKYVPAVATNIAKTFARVRKEMAEQKEREEASKREAEDKVRPLTKKQA